MDDVVRTLKEKITETKDWFAKELAGVRTGRATPQLLDAIRVDSYGTLTPLSQIASIGVEDARTLLITPWDKEHIKSIEKAISDADLGVSVSAGDTSARVIFPELTAERRALLNKIVREKLEQAKIALRSVRNDAIESLEKMKRASELSEDAFFAGKDEVQKIIDAGVGELDAFAAKKSEEIEQ